MCGCWIILCHCYSLITVIWLSKSYWYQTFLVCSFQLAGHAFHLQMPHFTGFSFPDHILESCSSSSFPIPLSLFSVSFCFALLCFSGLVSLLWPTLYWAVPPQTALMHNQNGSAGAANERKLCASLAAMPGTSMPSPSTVSRLSPTVTRRGLELSLTVMGSNKQL